MALITGSQVESQVRCCSLLVIWTRIAMVALSVVAVPVSGASSFASAATRAAAPGRTNTTARTTTAKAVDLNRADAKTLESLPGIGPALAQRIIEGRPYQQVEELDRVKGIGKAKLESLEGLVTVGSITAQKGTVAGSRTTAGVTNPPVKQAGTAQAASRAGSEAAPGPKLRPGEKVNINTATQQQLQQLPGIGPAKASAIVEYRQQHGKFATAEEIQKVKGIKAGAFGRIKDSITVAE